MSDVLERNILVLVTAFELGFIAEPQFKELCGEIPSLDPCEVGPELQRRNLIDQAQCERVVEDSDSQLEKARGDPGIAWRATASAKTLGILERLDGFGQPEASGQQAPDFKETLVTLPNQMRYRRKAGHAEGGMGRVFRVRDKTLGREVALKELKPDLVADDNIRCMFLREAQICAQLQHPNILPVFELANRGEDGRPYYTMPFIDGPTLHTEIQSVHADDPTNKSRFRELLHRFVAVCRAVAYAHSRGVVHGDLKPQNVMLGKYGEVLVLDWGLARPSPDASSQVHPVNLPAETSAFDEPSPGGSPAYMSPEQAGGDIGAIDVRTDVYGLGAVFFEILTNSAPHEGETSKLKDLTRQVATGALPDVGQRGVNVPPRLAAICRRAMDVNKSDRYQDANQLADDVESYLADEPVAAYPDQVWDHGRRFVKRHRVLAGSALSLVFFGLLAAVAVVGVVTHTNGLLQASNDNLVERNDELSEALAKNETLLKTTQRVVGLVQDQMDPYELASMISKRSETLFEERNDKPGVPGAEISQESLLELLRAMEKSEQALSYFARTRESAKSLHLESLAHCERAIAAAPTWMLPYFWASFACQNLRDHEQALRYAETARDFAPRNSTVIAEIGSCLESLERYAEAADAYDTAIRMGLNSAQAYMDYGDCLWYLDRFEDSLVQYEAAIEVAESPAETLRALKSIADALEPLKRSEEALPKLQAALKIDPTNVYVLLSVASCYREMGRHEDEFRTVTDLMSNYPPHLEGRLYYDRAMAHFELGNLAEAVADSQRATELRPAKPNAWLYHAKTLTAVKQYDKAIGALDQAIDLAPGDAMTYCRALEVHLMQGSHDKVVAFAEETPDTVAGSKVRGMREFFKIVAGILVGDPQLEDERRISEMTMEDDFKVDWDWRFFENWLETEQISDQKNKAIRNWYSLLKS